MTGTSKRLARAPIASSDDSVVNERDEDRQFASTLARGLAVLRCFTPEDQLLGNRELSVRTGLSRPTITRLTYTLTRLGYLAYFPKLGRYRLAPGILSLGYPLLAGLTIRQIARPFMEQLASHSRGNVSLAMRAGLEMIYADTVRSTTGMLQPPDIGVRFPIHNGASGRAYLAACPDSEREAILAQLQAVSPADAWPERYREIEREIERYRRYGFCVATAARPGIHAVGVPIKGVNPEIIVVNCGVPVFELKGDALYEDIAPRLMSVARNIEMAVGANQFRSSTGGGLP